MLLAWLLKLEQTWFLRYTIYGLNGFKNRTGQRIGKRTGSRTWLLEGEKKRKRNGREKKETNFLKLFDYVAYII